MIKYLSINQHLNNLNLNFLSSELLCEIFFHETTTIVTGEGYHIGYWKKSTDMKPRKIGTEDG